MADVLLTVNAGSSSLKLAAFHIGPDAPVPWLRGELEHLDATPRVTLRCGGDVVLQREIGAAEAWPGDLLGLLGGLPGGGRVAAVGHRVVHGGTAHVTPVRVTPAVLEELRALTPLAPLHQGHNLDPIAALLRLDPALPQVACFDTAFHATLPDEAARFALPRALHDDGLRRYGAHGLSYEYIAGRLRRDEPALAAGRVVVAHLGSGASLCALRDGRSIDTTMGLTPLDGLVMGTRCGLLDPGAVLFLLARGMTAEAVQDVLYHRSGLLGVSGESGDMRALHASASAAAAQAVALFVHRLVREIAAMAASLDGIDAVVFTGGIGEHDATVRAAAAGRLAWLGLDLDAEANRTGAARVSTPASRVAILVMPTDEEAVIARHTQELL